MLVPSKSIEQKAEKKKQGYIHEQNTSEIRTKQNIQRRAPIKIAKLQHLQQVPSPCFLSAQGNRRNQQKLASR